MRCQHTVDGDAAVCKVCWRCVSRFVKAHEVELRADAAARSPKVAAAKAARDKWLATHRARAADTGAVDDLEAEFGPEIAAMVRRNPDRGAPRGEQHDSRYGWLDAVRR